MAYAKSTTCQELDAAVLAIFQETNSSAASGSIRNLFEEWAHGQQRLYDANMMPT